jgi:hypothetical protein
MIHLDFGMFDRLTREKAESDAYIVELQTDLLLAFVKIKTLNRRLELVRTALEKGDYYGNTAQDAPTAVR